MVENGVVKLFVTSKNYNFERPFDTPFHGSVTGSGFFVKINGTPYILTAAHVVQHDKEINVQLPSSGGGHLFKTSLLGIDIGHDIALLDLKHGFPIESIKILEFVDNSDDVDIGTKVNALGYQLHLDNISNVPGEISAIQHSHFQITNPINHGNSGGPLLHEERVVGMCVSGYDPSEAQNINFAVPSTIIKNMLPFLLKKDLLRNVNLGFLLQNTNTDLSGAALKCDMCELGGQLISEVIPFSNAADTLSPGDMVCAYKYNNTEWIKISHHGDVKVPWFRKYALSFWEDIIPRFLVGKDISFKVWSEDTLKEIAYTLQSMPVPVRLCWPSLEPETLNYVCFGPVCVMELRKNHILIPKEAFQRLINYSTGRKQLKTYLVVTFILEKRGEMRTLDTIKQGDIITTVNEQAVHTLEEYAAALRSPVSNSVGKPSILWETESGIQTLLLVANILEHEDEQIESYNYNPSFYKSYPSRLITPV